MNEIRSTIKGYIKLERSIDCRVCTYDVGVNEPISVLQVATEFLLLAAAIDDEVSIACDHDFGLAEHEVVLIEVLGFLEFDAFGSLQTVDLAGVQ